MRTNRAFATLRATVSLSERLRTGCRATSSSPSARGPQPFLSRTDVGFHTVALSGPCLVLGPQKLGNTPAERAVGAPTWQVVFSPVSTRSITPSCWSF